MSLFCSWVDLLAIGMNKKIKQIELESRKERRVRLDRRFDLEYATIKSRANSMDASGALQFQVDQLFVMLKEFMLAAV